MSKNAERDFDAAEQCYLNMLRGIPDAYHRTPEQQDRVDRLLSAKLHAYYAMIHHHGDIHESV